MARSRTHSPLTMADVGARDRWLGIVRFTRPVCSGIAPRPLLGTALAGTLLLVAEILVRVDEFVALLTRTRGREGC